MPIAARFHQLFVPILRVLFVQKVFAQRLLCFYANSDRIRFGKNIEIECQNGCHLLLILSFFATAVATAARKFDNIRIPNNLIELTTLHGSLRLRLIVFSIVHYMYTNKISRHIECVCSFCVTFQQKKNAHTSASIWLM